MHWRYQITAASQPRVLPRLIQLFEQQLLVIRAPDLALGDRSVTTNITVEADSELAQRLQAKLYHQIDVQQVELIPAQPAAARTVKSVSRNGQQRRHAVTAQRA